MGGDDDDSIFRDAMRGVRPLSRRSATPVPPRPRATARYSRAEHSVVLRESLAEPLDTSLLESGEQLAYARPGTSRDVLRRLRRGQYALQAELDLHGLGRQAAHQALRDFMAEAVDRGLRCVRVIHGKGHRSGAGGPVLKRVVDHWLRRIKPVAAFVSARPVDGGTGAVYVLLSSRRHRPG